MNTQKRTYYYAVVDENSGKLIIESGHLPIFWLKKVAKRYNWEGTRIERISDVDLTKILNGNTKTQARTNATKKR